MTSSTMASYGRARAIHSASSPQAATSAECPSSCSPRRSSPASFGSSSTISSRITGHCGFHRRPEPRDRSHRSLIEDPLPLRLDGRPRHGESARARPAPGATRGAHRRHGRQPAPDRVDRGRASRSPGRRGCHHLRHPTAALRSRLRRHASDPTDPAQARQHGLPVRSLLHRESPVSHRRSTPPRPTPAGPGRRALDGRAVRDRRGVGHLGPRSGSLVGLHKASFVVWLIAMAAHVLAHALRVPGLTSADWRRGNNVPGSSLRRWLLAGSLVAGVILAVATVHLADLPWHQEPPGLRLRPTGVVSWAREAPLPPASREVGVGRSHAS